MNNSIMRTFILIACMLPVHAALTAGPGASPRRAVTPGPGGAGCATATRSMAKYLVGSGVPAAGLQAAGGEKPQTLTKKQIQELVAGGVPSQRIAELVRDRGIDFQVDDAYISTLRHAGATDVLINALNRASRATATLTVETAPNAQVFLDGELRGKADAKGALAMRVEPGAHILKVSLAGKQDFQQNVSVPERQAVEVVAPLTDQAGSVRVHAPMGAAVWVDNSFRGTVDANGVFLANGIPVGSRVMRVTARGKVDYVQTVNVVANSETQVEAVLIESVRVNPQDGLQYVWISPGTFVMGCSPGDNECSDQEKPAHQVTLTKAYWIGQTDVTVGAYKGFVNATGGKMPPEAPKVYRHWDRSRFPMVDITWNEASSYCAWAGGRLPTEAEWECAARGGGSQARYGPLGEIAWNKENAKNQAHAVGSKLPNGFGLFDMLGNVWEWVNDWYDPNFYHSGAAQNPTGPATGQEKVLRGGSWIVDPRMLRVSERYSFKPDARSDFFGFRCVWEPKNP